MARTQLIEDRLPVLRHRIRGRPLWPSSSARSLATLVGHLPVVPALKGATQRRPRASGRSGERVAAGRVRSAPRFAGVSVRRIGGDLLELLRRGLGQPSSSSLEQQRRSATHAGSSASSRDGLFQSAPSSSRVHEPAPRAHRTPALGEPEHRPARRPAVRSGPPALGERPLGRARGLPSLRRTSPTSTHPAATLRHSVEPAAISSQARRASRSARYQVPALLQIAAWCTAADPGPHRERVPLRPAQSSRRSTRAARAPGRRSCFAGADHAAQHLRRWLSTATGGPRRLTHRLVEVPARPSSTGRPRRSARGLAAWLRPRPRDPTERQPSRRQSRSTSRRHRALAAVRSPAPWEPSSSRSDQGAELPRTRRLVLARVPRRARRSQAPAIARPHLHRLVLPQRRRPGRRSPGRRGPSYRR